MTVRETGLYYLQSRYYNPTWGRFLNADGYTSTGQGMLGNNMFAYCLNNPVNCYDPSGTAAFWTSTGDWNPVHTIFFGCGGGGGGISGCGGSGNSGYKDIIDELSDKTDKTLDAISAVAEDCWDAYMRGYNLQQETQMQEAQMMVDVVIETYYVLEENEVISIGKASASAYTAANEFKKGIAYFAMPAPTPIDEYLGCVHMLKGLCYWLKGLEEVFE